MSRPTSLWHAINRDPDADPLVSAGLLGLCIGIFAGLVVLTVLLLDLLPLLAVNQ